MLVFRAMPAKKTRSVTIKLDTKEWLGLRTRALRASRREEKNVSSSEILRRGLYRLPPDVLPIGEGEGE